MVHGRHGSSLGIPKDEEEEAGNAHNGSIKAVQHQPLKPFNLTDQKRPGLIQRSFVQACVVRQATDTMANKVIDWLLDPQ